VPSDPPRRILAIQLRRLGDLILTTPALRALKEGWPRARITVLTERPFDDVLAGNPAVDEVWLHRRGALSSLACGAGLRRARFDVVLDFHGNPSSARLAWQTGAPLRIGWAHRLRRLAYTRALPLSPDGPARHTALAHLDLVRAMAGTHPGRPWSGGTAGPELFVTGLELAEGRDVAARAGIPPGVPFLAAAPASRRAYKEWPRESFAEVLGRFHHATGAPILLIGGPGEDAMLEAVAARWSERMSGWRPPGASPPADAPAAAAGSPVDPYPPALPAARLSTVRSLIGCLAGSAAFFGPDGGARQIAEALGVPTLGLFGPQEPAVWTRLSSRHRAVSGRRPDCRIRCSRVQAPCACLAGVDPAGVAAELIGLWRGEVGAAGRRAVEVPGAGAGSS
jgi:ADP-heptose:LPS heptosyltransferase